MMAVESTCCDRELSESRLFDVHRGPDALVVRFGETVDSLNFAELIDDLCRLAASERPKRLLLNMEGMQFLQTTAVRRLQRLEQSVRQTGGELKVCNICPELQRMFLLTGGCVDWALSDHEAESVQHWGKLRIPATLAAGPDDAPKFKSTRTPSVAAARSGSCSVPPTTPAVRVFRKVGDSILTVWVLISLYGKWGLLAGTVLVSAAYLVYGRDVQSAHSLCRTYYADWNRMRQADCEGTDWSNFRARIRNNIEPLIQRFSSRGAARGAAEDHLLQAMRSLMALIETHPDHAADEEREFLRHLHKAEEHMSK